MNHLQRAWALILIYIYFNPGEYTVKFAFCLALSKIATHLSQTKDSTCGRQTISQRSDQYLVYLNAILVLGHWHAVVQTAHHRELVMPRDYKSKLSSVPPLFHFAPAHPIPASSRQHTLPLQDHWPEAARGFLQVICIGCDGGAPRSFPDALPLADGNRWARGYEWGSLPPQKLKMSDPTSHIKCYFFLGKVI